jgi:hypothetical protein
MRTIPTVAALLLALAVAFTDPTSAPAQSSNGLTTVTNPGGGQVVYGPLTNVTSLRDVMAAMLKNVHSRFGDKPQIGKFFQTRGSDSTATFFHLTARNQGNKPIAGMVIVSLAPGAKTGAAAVLYDDAARFPKTQSALMQKLNTSWHHDSAKIATSHPTHASNPTEPANRGNGPGGIFGTNEPATSSRVLHLARNPDNSGSIGLPEDWHVTGGSGGSLTAEGPHGAMIRMGVLVGNIYDPHTPQGSNMLNYLSKGSTPFYACSLSADLPTDFLCVTNQFRQRQHEPALTMNVISHRLSPQDPSQGAFLAEIDCHDGKGPMISSMKIGVHRMGPANWTLTIHEVRLPKSIPNDEWSTAAGMIMSYRQNSAVIQQETISVINQINEQAKANQIRIDATTKQHDAHNAQVNEQWDQQARQNKAFENYTLDYAVLHDPSDNGSWGRTDYPTADWLVKAAPDRFQYAQTQDLLKGIDY